jgi:hypothetical protein
VQSEFLLLSDVWSHRRLRSSAMGAGWTIDSFHLIMLVVLFVVGLGTEFPGRYMEDLVTPSPSPTLGPSATPYPNVTMGGSTHGLSSFTL